MLKKIIALFTAFVVGFGLTACSTLSDIGNNSKESTETTKEEPVVEEPATENMGEESVTYINDSQEGIVSKITIFYEGDHVLRQITENTLDLTKYAGSEEQIINKVKEVGEQYKNVKGIVYVLDVFQKEIVEHINVDFMNLDGEKAKNIPGFTLTGDPKIVSLKKTKEFVEQAGYRLQ